MKYNLSNKEEKQQATDYFNKLVEKKSIVEIKKCLNRRTYAQNNYLHLLLSYVALEIGEELEWFKSEIWKKIIAPDIFKTEYKNIKTGEVREDWKSSADLDTKEMTIAVERLMNWSAKELGILLPLATDIHELRSIENHIEINKNYL